MIDLKYINKCFRWLLNNTVDSYLTNLLDSDTQKHMKIFYDCVSSKISWEDLEREDLLQLGAVCCNDGDPNELWLLPRWIFPIIPKGTRVKNMKDETEFLFDAKTAPQDSVYGQLSFGVTLDAAKNKIII